MEVAAQRRMAARISKCGESRIWMDPAKLGEVSQAITSADVRRLILSGVILAKPIVGLSSGRKRYNISQKKKGRRKGKGSRKGALGSRFSRKRSWINVVRAQRSMLKEMLASGKIDKALYKKMYYQSKGGYFRSRAHLTAHVEELGRMKIAELEARERAVKKKGK